MALSIPNRAKRKNIRILPTAYFVVCGAAGAGEAGAAAGTSAAGVPDVGIGAVCCATGLAAPSISELPLRDAE